MSDQEPPATSLIDPTGMDTILVVEDSAPNRMALVFILKKLGLRVCECADGDVAWKILRSGSEKNIVAVFSDLMMPNMDGLELLRHVRADQNLTQLPFVLITAVSDQDFISEAKKLKVNGYILKPITYQRVFFKLRELFPKNNFPQLVS
jgi:two-component system chemotaxis response regulator CheY